MGTAVVIPVYNAEAFIQNTLESVFRQTRSPEEIVVVDDRSTDGTVAVVEGLSRRSPAPLRVVVLAANSGGPARPLNVALASCRSEFISLLDHDDLMEPEKLEIQQRCFDVFPEAGLVFSDYRWFTGSRDLVGMQTEEIDLVQRHASEKQGFFLLSGGSATMLQVRYPGLIQSCSNLFFKRAVFDQAGPFDETQSALSDYVFKLNVTVRNLVAFIPRVLFQKRLHEKNLFGTSCSPVLLRNIYRIGFKAIANNRHLLDATPGMTDEFRRHLLDLAFDLRRQGLMSLSLWVHLQNLRLLGADRATLVDLVKWPVGAARDAIWARRPQHAS